MYKKLCDMQNMFDGKSSNIVYRLYNHEHKTCPLSSVYTCIVSGFYFTLYVELCVMCANRIILYVLLHAMCVC